MYNLTTVDGKRISVRKYALSHPNLKVSAETVRRRLAKISEQRPLTMADVEEAITTPNQGNRPQDLASRGEIFRPKSKRAISRMREGQKKKKPFFDWSSIGVFKAKCKTAGRYAAEDA